MRPLACWLGRHDWLRAYSPGHVRLRCVECGTETPGWHGPTVEPVPPVVRKRRKAKAAVVRLQKRRTA